MTTIGKGGNDGAIRLLEAVGPVGARKRLAAGGARGWTPRGSF